jgi:hypothetical protein
MPLGDRFFVKFAWSRPAALRLAREIGVLTALAREPTVPFLPEVVASSADPLLMITRRVPGTSLFEIAGSIDPDHAGRSSCGSWPPCTTRLPASAPRPPSVRSPARSCRRWTQGRAVPGEIASYEPGDIDLAIRSAPNAGDSGRSPHGTPFRHRQTESAS